ncbi:MAG: serine hydrolase, partial [Fimbriimonadales bacterium]|nr:serine hydrolase [Fimbriimonadales bacterium]
ALVNGRLLSPRTLEIMWTPQRLRNGQWTNYGLGWGIGEFLGRRIVYHGGAQQGTRTYLLVFPEEHVVITVLSNFENDQPSRLARRLAEIWFGQGEKNGVVVAESKPVASRTTKTQSPSGGSKRPVSAGKKVAPK